MRLREQGTNKFKVRAKHVRCGTSLLARAGAGGGRAVLAGDLALQDLHSMRYQVLKPRKASARLARAPRHCQQQAARTVQLRPGATLRPWPCTSPAPHRPLLRPLILRRLLLLNGPHPPHLGRKDTSPEDDGRSGCTRRCNHNLWPQLRLKCVCCQCWVDISWCYRGIKKDQECAGSLRQGCGVLREALLAAAPAGCRSFRWRRHPGLRAADIAAPAAPHASRAAHAGLCGCGCNLRGGHGARGGLLGKEPVMREQEVVQ